MNYEQIKKHIISVFNSVVQSGLVQFKHDLFVSVLLHFQSNLKLNVYNIKMH